MDVTYVARLHRKFMYSGSGQVSDLSSAGLRFMADQPLQRGLEIEASVRWPVFLEGWVELQLKVTGEVVWSRGVETALRFDRHEFRTRVSDGRVPRP